MVAVCDFSSAAEHPNFVVVLCDNLGYGDVGCFGSSIHRTPHLDRMAKEGMRLTSFYVSAGVCTPSRASFMTGCYAQRTGLHWNDRDAWVLRPISPYGLDATETTIAELLKSVGYATGIVGKWHLGDQPEFLPTRHGFDSYYGVPYSDDMTSIKGNARGDSWPPLPLMVDERVIEAPVDRSTLTTRYTDAAISFMEQHRDEPFFLYLAHAMPGSTKQPFASKAFRGRSKNGAFGDAVEEIDWSTGQILSTIKRLGIDRRTLVIWTSDNGAPKRNPPQGRSGPLKGFGYDTSEGAMRVCCVARWPGRIPANTVCDELTTSMDLLPTFVGLTVADFKSEVDGRDIRSLLLDAPKATSPHDVFFYYHNRQLQAGFKK